LEAQGKKKPTLNKSVDPGSNDVFAKAKTRESPGGAINFFLNLFQTETFLY
jgi:hypothetical protein